MRTRLPPVLAALGAALLLSSIEAEGKRLLSPPCPGENSRKTGEKKKKPKTQIRPYSPLLLALFPLHFVFPPGVSPFRRNTPFS